MASVEIEISLEEKKALESLTKLIKKTDEFGAAGEKNFNGATGAFNVFKGALGAGLVLKAFDSAIAVSKELFNVFAVDGVKSAIAEEEAIKRLDTALQLAGNTTKGTKESLVEFANELERTTGISDDAAISNIALLQSLAPLTEKGLKEATKAAADLSSALGVDLETATRALAGAANGNLAQLQKLTKQTFKEGATDAETFKNALEQLQGAFGGAAIKNFDTFNGAITGTQNAFEDLIKSFGRIVIENEAVKSAIRLVGAAFGELENFINANKDRINKFITNGVLFLVEAFKVGVQAVKDFFAAFEESGSFLNLIGKELKTIGQLVFNLGEIIVGVGVLAIDGLRFALASLGLTFDDVIGGIKVFIGVLLQGLIFNVQLAFDALGSLIGIFDKELGEKIKGAIQPIRQFSQELTNAGVDQIAGANELVEAKKTEVEAFKAGNEQKVESEKLTTELLKTEGQRQVDVFAELRQSRLDQDAEFDAIEAEIKTAQDEAEFQRLADNLGREEALRTLSESKKLAEEGKTVEARKKLREADRKAAEKDLGSLFDFEKNTNAGRAANFKSTLGTIATLQSQSNSTLFAIGKAAAISTATIDGIAAVQKALASAPPPFNFALAALVGVATAANLAKIASAQPPSRQSGGFVPGVFSPTDNTLINAAPGELVLNRRQQTNLFNAINQDQIGGGGGGGVNVVIQGNVMADDDSQVQKLIDRINENILYRNARLEV